MKIKFFNTSILLGVLLGFSACTDLELDETDSRFRTDAGGGFSGVEDVASALANSYNSIRGQLEGHESIYALNEATTDELLIPTRGTDWGDNGVWRTLHQHTWDSNHNFVVQAWNNHNRNVFNLSEIIAPESNANPEQLAEAKFLRAFSMFWVMDLFGQVPFREVNEGADVDPRVLTRTEAFEFIVKDLTEALPDLSSVGPGTETLFANKAAAHYMLAKLHLNKHVYYDAEPAAADMNQVISNVDAISDLGFGLQSGYFEIFKPSVDSETIWHTTSGVGNRIWGGLHYFQTAPDNPGGGWNGFSTLSEFYNLFEGSEEHNHPDAGQEERRGFVPYEGTRVGEGDGYFAGGKDDDGDGFVDASDIGIGFLFGQQYELDGSMTLDRGGNPLYYTKELPGLLGNNERTGIRVLKYHPSNGAYTGHLVVFRYGDAHLMKAEAAMRGGTAEKSALELVNELREIREATPLGNLGEQEMIDERGREVWTEYWRRQDLIRFGQFTRAYEFKPESGAHRVLFPIPSIAITSNPNLTQNPGY